MIDYIIMLLSLVSPMWAYALNHLMMLLFVATVPVLIREIFRSHV